VALGSLMSPRSLSAFLYRAQWLFAGSPLTRYTGTRAGCRECKSVFSCLPPCRFEQLKLLLSRFFDYLGAGKDPQNIP